MIQQTFTMAVRVLVKNWLYTLLCVLSLVFGMTAFLTNVAVVERAKTMDQDLTHYDRIYHFYNHWLNLDISRSFATSTKTAEFLKTRFPDLEQVTRMGGMRSLVVETPRLKQYEPIYLTDSNFFEVFDYGFVSGDPSTALIEPFSVVLSEAAAARFFGVENPIGQTITVDGEHIFRVSAVIENLPPTSHLTIGLGKVDVMVPLQTFENMNPDDIFTFGWGSDASLTFAVVPPTVTDAELNGGLKSLVIDHWPDLFHDELEIKVRPLKVLFDDLVKIGEIPLTDIVMILGVAVLIVACANFASLVVAQNVGRSHEVALRKAVGSGRGMIIGQFFVEGLIVSVVALVLSMLLIPSLLSYLSTNRFPLGLDVFLSTRGAFWLILLAPAVTLIGCVYPAVRVSAKSPNAVFQQSASTGKQSSLFRGAIVTVQFVLAIVLFIGTAVTWTQQRHLMNFDLRYTQDQIIVVERLMYPKVRERLAVFKDRLDGVPDIQQIAASNQVPAENWYNNGIYYHAGASPEDTLWLTQTFADPSFFDIYGIGLLAGRTLTRDNTNDVVEHGKNLEETSFLNVILNEEAVRLFGWATTRDAVGKVLVNTEGSRLTVVGVVENTRIRSSATGFDPTIFMTVDDYVSKLSMKVTAENMDMVISDMEEAWDEVYPEFPIRWQFLGEKFAVVYDAAQRDQFFLAFACVFALVISCLGLFGLAGYVAEARTKEIGVRKVMGATVTRIVRLLLWDFSKPILLANIIAWPLAYLAMRSYLDGYAERVALSPLFFIGSGLAALVIAWLVVAAHVIRAARTHPANALRYE